MKEAVGRAVTAAAVNSNGRPWGDRQGHVGQLR